MEHQKPFCGTEESLEPGVLSQIIEQWSGMVLVSNDQSVCFNRLSECLQKGERMKVTIRNYDRGNI